MQTLRRIVLLGFCAAAAHAEVHVMNLRQAVDLALQQNPDIALARLDEQKATVAVRLAKAPFSTSIYTGSGLAYANGFPLTIDGAAPSIVQARAKQYLFNRQQRYVVAAARETARGAGIGTSAKRDEVAFRTTSMFLDALRDGRLAEVAQKQVESLVKIQGAMLARVQEGRELPIESKRAALQLARGRQRVEELTVDQDAAERALAVVLGFSADDHVRPAPEEPVAPPALPSEDAAVQDALQSSKEVRRLESTLVAKGLDVRAQKSARWPTVDLIAQWALFAKFNHYADYFRSFQTNNGEIGASLAIPILPGPGYRAGVEQAESEAAHVRIELNALRNRISLETRQSFQTLHKAETAREVAQLDLAVAREQVSNALSQMNEGRATIQQVAQLQFNEDEKWIVFYDAQYAAEKAAWDVLRQTGNLMAALK